MVFVGLDWVFLDTSEPALTTSALLIPTFGRTTEGWSPPKAGGGLWPGALLHFPIMRAETPQLGRGSNASRLAASPLHHLDFRGLGLASVEVRSAEGSPAPRRRPQEPHPPPWGSPLGRAGEP